MKKKIKKIIIISLIVIFLLIILNFIRNYIIINNIIDKQKQFKDFKNYSFTRMDYSTEEGAQKIELKVYFKDGIGLIEFPNYNYVWCNTESQAMIHFNTNEKTVSYSVGEFFGMKSESFSMEHLSFQEKVLKAICSIISTKDIDNEKCYCIQTFKQGQTYISKNTGIPIKTVGESIVVQGGKKYESIVEIRNWTTGKVTDDDVAKPDLKEYEIIEN